MNDCVMASIKPRFCWLIEKGKKPWELRTTCPKLDLPFKCYIYCTLNGSREFFVEQLGGDVAEWNRGKWWGKKGNVIGEFVCDRIEAAVTYGGTGPICNQTIIEASGLTQKEVLAYSKGKTVYAWHISKLQMYEEPKMISEFRVCKQTAMWIVTDHLKRPPQSWCYVNDLDKTA